MSEDVAEQVRRALERAGVEVSEDDLALVLGFAAWTRPSPRPRMSTEPALVPVPREWPAR